MPTPTTASEPSRASGLRSLTAGTLTPLAEVDHGSRIRYPRFGRDDGGGGSQVSAPAGTGRTVVIGAGPAGLTAALELGKLGLDGVVFEADDIVGGISRSVAFDGCRLDIGGHRFFTKVPEVEALWLPSQGTRSQGLWRSSPALLQRLRALPTLLLP